MNDIHPIYQRMLSRAERQSALHQRGVAFWFTGLSGSGKSTLAVALERELYIRGYVAQVLDGDNIRDGLNKNLGFSMEDREENIRRIAEVTKLYVHSGLIAICSFISPVADLRKMARDIIGPGDFIEVYIDTPLEVCEARDVKGLYKKARGGALPGFTGIDSPYEPPVLADLVIKTAETSVGQCVEQLLYFALPIVKQY